jgi:tetratricopeptide (TPR) repeat protein
LQQRFEEAQRLSGRALPDFRTIHLVLSECLKADPGNLLYVDAMLANLRKRDAAAPQRSWISRWFGGWSRPKAGAPTTGKGPVANAPDSAGPKANLQMLIDAGDALWEGPLNAATLGQLAEAAGECGFDEAELRYLTAAREVSCDDPQTLRRLARMLTRQGRFEEAVGTWSALHQRIPADSETAQALDDLRMPSARAVEFSSANPAPNQLSSEAESLIKQARSLQLGGDFAAAEELLTRAQAASGGDLAVLHLREELRLLQSEHRLAIARRRAASDPHPKTESLLLRLADEHNRLEIEIWNLRAERLPATAEVRVELARRLKRIGNFSGAIQRLAEAQKLSPGNPEMLIVMGECWQHLRQFDKALHFYEQAVARSKSLAPTDEVRKLAGYRAGALSAALGQADPAIGFFESVVAADPEFKDARERLDKLRAN